MYESQNSMTLRTCPACLKDSGRMEMRNECFYCASTREGCSYLLERGMSPLTALEALRHLTQIGGICLDVARKYHFTYKTSDDNAH